MEGSFFCVFRRALLFLSLHVLMICFMHQGYTYGVEGKITSRTVPVGSLLPSTSCSPSTTKASNRKSTLEVIHKHGPCSQLVQDQNPLNHTKILLQDESRVKLASARLFDTGSPLTWTQCKPCVGSCYNQSDPIFNPSRSSSYANVSCASTACSQLSSGQGGSRCNGTCPYSIRYGDDSFSIGFLATEKLTISPTEMIDNFAFGCCENNQGLFGRAAGLIGLSDSNISIVEQTAAKYDKYFSYCLPSSTSFTGHLTFGKDGRAPCSVSFTPLSTVPQNSEFYGISIIGISVEGKPLSIPSTVFSNAGAVIDSGTVITRLPPTAYSALRTTVRKAMANYTTAPAVSLFDTCYDFSKESTVVIPSITFSFAEGVNIDLDHSGIFYVEDASHVCLAFAANAADSDLVIYGNTQPRTFEVVYDVAGRKLGFGPNGCS
ncbi:hypothetical protein EUGRSUZ_G01376 [Eucalyptus grandis]|uniref:Uncharacterized protein n=2 Tax=Eucalyptus grandis TaxID=71139 RepID=A0ACC3K249_EUCGR|nr:hypothetical protein EUGRSUZ_G01376 [Eucalyptus grandis]